MQWPGFDLIGRMFDHDTRISRIEERQEWALKEIDGQSDRISRLEKRLEQMTNGVGTALLAILVLLNLPPEISGKIIQLIAKLVPG